jgi:hypothetical protein
MALSVHRRRKGIFSRGSSNSYWPHPVSNDRTSARVIVTDGEIRTASLLPSEFFGTDEDPPTERHMYILAKLFAGLTRLTELTIPLPDHKPTFDLLSVKSLTTLRLTHAQPTVDLLYGLSQRCPSLLHLEFSLYPFQHAFWILTHDALVRCCGCYLWRMLCTNGLLLSTLRNHMPKRSHASRVSNI